MKGRVSSPASRASGEAAGRSSDALEADLFQVVVSPHHNDAHNNHVHLEVRPEVTWRSIQ